MRDLPAVFQDEDQINAARRDGFFQVVGEVIRAAGNASAEAHARCVGY